MFWGAEALASATGMNAEKLLLRPFSHSSNVIGTSICTQIPRYWTLPRYLMTRIWGQLKSPLICLRLLGSFRTQKSLLERFSQEDLEFTPSLIQGLRKHLGLLSTQSAPDI